MLTIQANAKINLYLEITGTLENGYHALSMIMQSISLGDTLTLEPADALCVHCPGVPQEQNSAFLAGQLFFEAAGLAGGARIEISKRIPSQAGLGGGSADAAAALLGLNALYGEPLSPGELARIAVRIGADVPFFLKGGCQQCQGIGEVLTPLENALCPYYLVVQPEGGVSTPAAYRKYDELGGRRGDLALCKQALAAGDLASFAGATANSLERAAKALCPPIAQALEFLQASADCALMTGSGSACIGLFAEKPRAEAALQKARARFPFARLAENVPAGICIPGGNNTEAL